MSQVSDIEIGKLLLEAARAAHDAITDSLASGGSQPLGTGAGGDVTLMVDRKAEEAVYQTCKNSGFGFTMLFEEMGLVDVNGGGVFLAVDALDGSRNAVRGIGSYASSLAASRTDRFEDVSVGVVMEHSTGKVYRAVRGEGASVDEGLLRIVKHGSLEEAIIGVDFCGIREEDMARLSRLVARAKAVRHIGANAFEISLVGSGGLDAHVDIRNRIRAVDIAAACLVVAEAGAVVTDMNGERITGALDLGSRFSVVAASDSKLHAEIMAMLVRR